MTHIDNVSEIYTGFLLTKVISYLLIDPESGEFGLPYSPYASLLMLKNNPTTRQPNITQLIQLFIGNF
jgi:hypothetical protein